MEALWHLEDKLNLTTQKAIALFACTSLLFIAICLAVVLRTKKLRTRGTTIHQEPCTNETSARAQPPVSPGRCSVVRALMRAVRWSGPSKWDESLLRQSQRETPTPLLEKRDIVVDVGWQSHNSTSAVWKKPILMGEKCELPRFSGLIIYICLGHLGEVCSSCENHAKGLAMINYLPLEFAYFSSGLPCGAVFALFMQYNTRQEWFRSH